MPALPAVSKVIRVDCVQSLPSNANVRDRFFLNFSGAASTTDMNTLASTIDAAWNTNMSPVLSNSLTLTLLELTDLSSNLGAQVIKAVARTGGGVGNSLPNGAALVIKFKIARRYRGGHPRWYQGGCLATNVINGDQVTGAFQTTLANAFAAFIAGCVLAPPAAMGVLSHVAVHYYAGFHNVTFPSGRTHAVPTQLAVPTFDSVIGYSTNTHLASQRRRNQQ